MKRIAVAVVLFGCSTGASVLHVACGSGGGDPGTDGGASGSSSGAGSSGTTSSSGTSGGSGTSGSSSGGGATTCAAAGGTCLNGLSCNAGFYGDNGALSCPPANGGDGPNQPCCLPATNNAACKGNLTGTKPTSCGATACGAGTNHCQVISGGPAGSGTTTACGTSTECDACPTCECLLSTNLRADCGGCTTKDGVATLTCAAP